VPALTIDCARVRRRPEVPYVPVSAVLYLLTRLPAGSTWSTRAGAAVIRWAVVVWLLVLVTLAWWLRRRSADGRA
jgi:hypothetical protein